MNNPLIYIILVNYNGLNDTIECIESINKINYDNYRIIVVDNNSKDYSINKLKNIENIILINSKVNLGFSGANNLGIKYALENNSEFILLLNNDTVVEKDFLNNIVNCIKLDNSVGMATGKILNYNEKDKIWFAGGEINKLIGNSVHLGYGKLHNDPQYGFKRYISFSTGCFMLIRSEAIKKVGNMSEDYFLYYEDSDYSMKFLKNKFKILYCPDSVIYHKVSSSTGNMSPLFQYYFTRNRLLFIKNNLNLKYRIIAYVSFYIDLLKNIVKRRGSLINYYRACKDFYNGKKGKSSYY